MIHITKCGYDSHHPIPCDIEHKTGLPNYLLLLVKSDAWFVQNGHHIYTKPGMAILFPPNTYIHYGCHHAGYNDDWVHFSCEDTSAASLLSEINLPLNEPLPLHDMQRMSRCVQLMTGELYAPSPHSREILHHLMLSLLYALSDEIIHKRLTVAAHRQYSAFLRLRTSIYNNPALPYSSEELARSMHLSVSRFQHLYKSFFATTAQNDIIHARIQMAGFYLQNSNMRIRALAAFCGYESEVHFMRQFKKIHGMTPSEFRKTQRSAPASPS